MIIPTLHEINAELARREHLEFIKYCWSMPAVKPYQVGIHSRAICERIDKALEDFKNGVSTFLMIKVPPRHGKSEIVSRNLPPRFLGMFPDEEAFVISYSASLAEEFSKDARKLVWGDEFKRARRKH